MQFLKKQKTPKSSEQLWAAFVKGDMVSFRMIYESHYKILYNFGLKYLSDYEVEDCMQSMFLYILQHRKSSSKVTNVKAYLLTSLRNSIFKYKKNKEVNYSFIENILVTEQVGISKEKLVIEVQKILQVLTPRENEIIKLKYFQNYKNKEIAEHLGVKYQTVRNILHNAFTKIRRDTLLDLSNL
jgi:RNA polymerase sigma factor (sigma-70 family)